MASRRFIAGLIGSGFILAAAGCQSGDPGSSVEVANAKDALKPPTEKVKESDLQGFCPRVTLREGTAYSNAYAKGGQDDPSKLLYQASITDVTRSCSRSGGMLNITVAVAGKLVPGPAGSPGSVTLPIRIAMLQGSNILYSELHKYPVAAADGSQAAQFVFNDPNISIPIPTQRDIQIFAGFDEGPPKKDSKKTASADE